MIVVEGLDGTGKTTLSRALARALGARWTTTPPPALRVIRTLFMGLLERSPEASQVFHGLSVLAVGLWARALTRLGVDVVVDRYWLTTAVYAEALGSRLELRRLERLIPPADVTLLVALSEVERRRRIEARGVNRLDASTLVAGAAERIDAGYRAALDRAVAGRALLLDITGLSVEASVAAALSEASGCRRAPPLPPPRRGGSCEVRPWQWAFRNLPF